MFMIKSLSVWPVGLLLVAIGVSCGGAGRNAPATTQPSAERPFRWLDSDGKQAADDLAAKLLASPAFHKVAAALGRAPVIKLSRLRNRSAEEIDREKIKHHLGRALLNSGKVTVAAPGVPGGEAPDLLLSGMINVSARRLADRWQRTYTLSLTLANLKTGASIWIDSYEVKVEKRARQ